MWKALGRCILFGTVWAVVSVTALALVKAGTGYDLKALHPWLYASVVNGPGGVYNAFVILGVLGANRRPA